MKHYPTVRLSRVLNGMKDGTHGTHPRVSEGLPLLSAKNVIGSSVQISDNESYIPIEASRSITSNGFPRRGDVLLTIVGTIGRSAVYNFDEPIAFQRSVAFLRPNLRLITPEYLNYAIQAPDFQDQLKLASKTSAQPGVYLSDVSACQIALPPLSEQMRIVAELDRELAEIDELIAEQEQLQALLLERLVALTFELATDSSNPDRYETGHHFWKTLPKGWTLQKLGWHFDIGNGSTPKSDNPQYWTDAPEEGFPWFNSSAVNQELAIAPARYVSELAVRECHLHIVPKGSLLMGMIGQGKTRGQVTKTGIDATLSQNIAYLTPAQNSQVNVDFVKITLEAAYSELREINSGNGTTKGSLTCEDIKQFEVPIPDFSYQIFANAKFSKNKDKTKKFIDFTDDLKLLQEMKTSIINSFLSENTSMQLRNTYK